MRKIFIIYYSPPGYAGMFMVREMEIDTIPPKEMDLEPFESLEIARTSIPAGKKNFGRQKNDDPSIVETWW